jgi:antitoxin (DNA-binding transcriptional repressor) of toxin-antitoxin stability system
VITRHGKPVAVVVPVEQWREEQARSLRQGGILALRGSGRGLWPEGAAPLVAQLREEWA